MSIYFVKLLLCEILKWNNKYSVEDLHLVKINPQHFAIKNVHN